MFRAWHDRARPLTTITSVLAALLLLMISLGVGGTASADPGNGKGAGQANAPAASTTAPATPAPTTHDVHHDEVRRIAEDHQGIDAREGVEGLRWGGVLAPDVGHGRHVR